MAILDTGFFIAFTIILVLSPATSVEDTECEQTQYVEIGTLGLIPCSCNGSSLALIAWNNVNEGKSILLLNDGEKSGDGYESREFDIYPNGSLLINNVTASHESVFRVSTAVSTSGSIHSNDICVRTTVKPAITIPAIEECSNTYGTTCVRSTAESVEVNCSVRDSRPAVKLTWTIRTHGGDHILPSNYRKFTTDNVTYTSHVTATFSFGESSVLSLLVCRANSVPLNLVEDEHVLLIEKKMDYTSMAIPIRRYFKIHSPMNLSCTDLRLNLVVWKWSPQQDAFETLYVGIFHKNNHTKISNKEYKLENEGSLSLQNALVEHEGLYACVYDNGVSGGIVLYDVLVIVDPTPVFPVIDGCNHQQYCALEKQPQDVLTCSVLGIRPKVALEWRAFREQTAIDFTQHQLTVTEMGDVYDLFLTVNFDFTLTTQNKVTVECRAVGENAEQFSLSTKVDLLFPNVLPTEQKSYTITITIIAVLVTMMLMMIITAVVVIICKIRARKMKMKRIKREDTDNEGIPMMENDYSEKAEPFIGQLKSKYEIFYDSVKPIPYIKDRMYCVDKVFVEGGIEYMTGISGGETQWDKLSSYQELVKENCLKTKRQILEGEPGYGKSTLTLQLLYDWCKSLSTSPLKEVDVIIYLRLRQLGGVKSIFSAIRRFILPRDSDISEEDIKEILKQMKSVLVLLDGFDEYPDQESTETDIYHIMKKNMFRGFNVILTTRPSCLPKDFAPHSDRVRLTGFEEEARRKYVGKAVVRTYGEAVDRIMRKLEENPVLDDLCQVPLFFVMFAHMTYENEHSSTFNSVTSFFRYMISCFHSHMKNKMKDENVTNFELLEKEHKVLDKIAFEALSGKNQKLVWNLEQLRNQLGHECYDLYLRIGLFLEEEVLNITDTSNHIQYNTEVHFHHKTVCEWYAAHYVAEQLSGGNTNCIDELLQNLDPFDLQYLYRFACGINKITGEKIIRYLQQKSENRKFAILCMLEQEDKTNRFIKTVSDLVSSKGTYIRKSDSKLLQRSTLQILDVASKNQIPISHLYLRCSFSGFDGKDIRLESGLCLSSLSSVEKISINGGGIKELSEEEVIGLIKYGITSLRFKEIWLHSCKLPSSIKPDIIPEESRSRNIKVISSRDACYLDLKSGKWSKPDDIHTITEMCSDALVIHRDTKKSVQRSVIELLVEASNRDLQIHRVTLVWSFSKIDEDGNIIVSSGLSLPILKSIERMSIQTEKGREMNKHEVNGIFNYVQHSPRFKKVVLSDCLLPSYLPIGSSLSALKSQDVKVIWTPDTNKWDQQYLLDQEFGIWLDYEPL
ncbi:uncharacterized protein [Apostichopus japonicus]|uniref:uncharacterized protein n=1 Tax=Stichopus japonicus TaxID=307972 RepID=UPI003AB581C5